MNPTSTLPDNLLSRVSRLHIAQKEFVDDKQNLVKYDRLVIEFSVNGTKVEQEYKIDKKDKLLISLADVVDGQAVL